MDITIHLTNKEAAGTHTENFMLGAQGAVDQVSDKTKGGLSSSLFLVMGMKTTMGFSSYLFFFPQKIPYMLL